MAQSLRTARRRRLASREAQKAWVGAVIVCFCALTMCVAAQLPPGVAAQLPPSSKTGNPTPGTPQPEPPNLADRITLTGCLQTTGENARVRSDAAIDSNSPSDSRFVLMKAERKNVAPPDTGTSSVAVNSASPTYRLNAIESQLSPFVGTKVEISGEILPSPATEPGGVKAPTLQVEFVQKLARNCS